MAKRLRLRLSNLKLLYLFKVTTFSIWLIVFISDSFEIFRLVFDLDRFLITYSVLCLINLLTESIIISLFMCLPSKKQIVINLLSKTSFYVLLCLLSLGVNYTWYSYSYLRFFGLTLTLLLLINLSKIIWSKLVIFRCKRFQAIFHL